jgi:hypothetical protein
VRTVVIGHFIGDDNLLLSLVFMIFLDQRSSSPFLF